jgi:hypothetical protein
MSFNPRFILPVLGFFLLVAPQAHATQTYAPTGAYVPGQQQQQPSQQVNVNVGGYSIKANNNGADINIPGMGSIKANQNGADINVNAGGQHMQVSGSNSGGSVQVSSSAMDVHSDADLPAYKAQLQSSNPSIIAVQSSSSNVIVDYTQQGKLFGFIPMPMQGEVKADAKGSVNVDLPWYSLFVTSSANTIKTDLSKSLPSIVATANGSLSASTQAQVMASISTEIAQN